MKNPTIILANGSFPKSKALLEVLDQSEQIICCDGAVNKLINSGREPNVIIGDLDSITPKIKKKYQDKLVHIEEQNTNDLTKAINWCISKDILDVVIMGATGEREDHTIANIALLSYYTKLLKVEIWTDNGRFIPISESKIFDAIKGQQISIFSQNTDIEISSKGLKYPLQNLKLKNWWMGTLNEATSNEFELIFKKMADIIVYIANN